jgi:hypothetical protein
MYTKGMQITNPTAAFNAPHKKTPAHAHQTAFYMNALTFKGALPLWPTRLSYNMADNPH